MWASAGLPAPCSTSVATHMQTAWTRTITCGMMIAVRTAIGGESGSLPTGVVSFALTDVEGSTAMWDSCAVETAVAIERHDVLIERTVRAHRGRFLKHRGEGDSTLSVFQRATDAVAAAESIVRAVEAETWPGALRLRVRVGVHTGEAFERDGDYFGPTVNRAARVRGLAVGGQILITRAMAELVVDQLPIGASLLDHGRHQLRGITRVERVFELVPGHAPPVHAVADAPRTAEQRWVVPIPVALRAEGPFVGRDPEVEILRGAWQLTTTGANRLVLISGEAGVGKTRLAAQLAAEVGSGATVWFGRCEEDLAAPYQPFIEGMRPWIATLDPTSLARIPTSALADATRFWPELAGRVPSLPLSVAGDPDQERHACFQAVVRLLAEASRDRPLLFVIDDLHWATSPTVLLLRHLTRVAAPLRVLFVGTYRDADIDDAHPLVAALADWRRAEQFTHLSLAGLDRAGIAAYVTAAGRHAIDDSLGDLASRLYDATAGNPFFLSELLASSGHVQLPDDAASPALPVGVRDVVAHRVARLPAAAQAALAVAAVIGQESTIEDLAAVLDESTQAGVLNAVEAVLATGLMVESGRKLAFKHALVRHCVIANLSSARTAYLHRRVAEAIEGQLGAAERVAELAFHFAAGGGNPERAARYGYQTGLRSLDLLAFDDACASFANARALLALCTNVDLELDLSVDIDLAHACALRGATTSGGRDECVRALRNATRLRDTDRAAACAVFLCEATGIAATNNEAVGLVEAATKLEGASTAARSQLASALAQIRERQGRHDEADCISTDALTDARASGSDEALYFALWARSVILLGTGSLAERCALVAEMTDAGERSRSAYIVNQATFLGGVAKLESGDRDGYEAAVAQLARSNAVSGTWMQDITVRSTSWHAAFLALLDGRWDEAAAHSDAMLAEAGDEPHPDVLAAYAGQVLQRARELGQHEQFLPLLEQAIADEPALIAYQAGLASMTAEMGDLDRARALLDALVDRDLSALPRDQEFPATLALLAEACATVADSAHASIVLAALTPYAGRVILIHSVVGVVGAADRFIAMLAATVGDHERAATAYHQAIELETRIRSRPHVARTQIWHARLHRICGDLDSARAVAARALVVADEFAMTRLATEARKLLA